MFHFHSSRKSSHSHSEGFLHEKHSHSMLSFGRFWNLFLEKPLLGYLLLTIVLMLAVYFLEGMSGFFKASILDSRVATFDGTVMPLRKVPNWVQTGGKNVEPYSAYSSKDLIALMPYNPNELGDESRDDSEIRNARITYSVMYLGNYLFEHKEEVGSHLAVDIRAPIGTPVYAVANAVVTKAARQSSGFGNHITLRIPKAPVNGKTEPLHVSYAHLSGVEVREGDIVKKGQMIGTVGDTGTATTPHLHFQIDRETAPWHPWWPFSSADASAAGLSFFEAINAGLGLQIAKENTINPMNWVQENMNGTFTPEIPNTAIEEPELGALTAFEIEMMPTEVMVNESFTVRVRAYDENDTLLTNFSERVSFSCSDKSIDIPAVKLSRGEVEFTLSAVNSGRVKCEVEAEGIEESERISVVEKDDDDLHAAPSEPTDSSNIGEIEVLPEQSFVLRGKTINVRLMARDRAGNILLNPDFSGVLEISAIGGKVNPQRVTADHFIQGVAEVRFIAGEEGTATVSVEDFGDAEISVVNDFKDVTAFAIETERKFIPNTPQQVVVRTIDEDGNVTPVRFWGTARVTFLKGEGVINPNELTADDFENGETTLEVVVTSGEEAELKVHSGALVGESGSLYADERSVFRDVRDNDDNAEAIAFLKKHSIVGGYPDGTFRPEAQVNRAEAAKMLVEGMKIAIASGKSALADVPEDAWFAKYVVTAEKEGMINGYPDKTFKPVNTINRAEFFKVLLEADNAAMDEVIENEPFSDVQASDWFAKYALYAKENELLDFDKWFNPNTDVTRGEFAEALYRLLK